MALYSTTNHQKYNKKHIKTIEIVMEVNNVVSIVITYCDKLLYWYYRSALLLSTAHFHVYTVQMVVSASQVIFN